MSKTRKLPDKIFYEIAYNGLRSSEKPKEYILNTQDVSVNNGITNIKTDSRVINIPANYTIEFEQGTFTKNGYYPYGTVAPTYNLKIKEIYRPNTKFSATLKILNPFKEWSSKRKIDAHVIYFVDAMGQFHGFCVREFFSTIAYEMKNGEISGDFVNDFYNGYTIIRKV